MKRPRTRADRRLPDALVVGPQRAGTTWIHQYLASRGDVALPAYAKETYFFDRRYDRGTDWYARRFSLAPSAVRVVEVASTYFHHPAAPERVRETLGDVPLVCTFRHPVDRAWSLYQHYQRYGMTRLDLRSAVETIPDIHQSLRYATHLRRWYAVFGRERVRVLLLEDLAADPRRYVQRLCTHFAVPMRELDERVLRPKNEHGRPRHPRLAAAATVAAHAVHGWGGSWLIAQARAWGLRDWLYGSDGDSPRPTMNEQDRQWLLARSRMETDDLEQLLGIDLSAWKHAPPRQSAA